MSDKLRKWERDILSDLASDDSMVEDKITIIECDGETARRVGEITSRLECRDSIDILRESKKDKSVIIDEDGKLEDMIDALV